MRDVQPRPRPDYKITAPKIVTVNGQPFMMGGISTSGGTSG